MAITTDGIGYRRMYCSACDRLQPFEVRKAEAEYHFGILGAWSHVRCAVCHRDILLLLMPGAGHYDFTKVESGPDIGDAPRVYCELCQAVKVLGIEEMQQDHCFPTNGIWGDVLCSECHLVLTSVGVSEPGWYTFSSV